MIKTGVQLDSRKEEGNHHGFCAINMPPSWQSVHCCQLGVWSVEEQFTEREVYFSLNGTTNVKQRGRKWDFSSQPLLSNARSAEFSSMKVTKLCYEKYFVLVSNHNVIGSKDLKLVSNWFERILVISVGKLFFCNWSSRHTVMLMMLLSSVSYHTNCKWKPFPSLQLTCPLLFAFLKFLLKMASKKPKSPPKLRLSGHPVRNSVFVTIGNCKRPQILRSEFFSSVTHWCLLRPVFVTSGSSLLTTLTSVSNAFTDFWGLIYFLSKQNSKYLYHYWVRLWIF